MGPWEPYAKLLLQNDIFFWRNIHIFRTKLLHLSVLLVKKYTSSIYEKGMSFCLVNWAFPFVSSWRPISCRKVAKGFYAFEGKEKHLGIKKTHLNSKGVSIFDKNLLKFIEEDWDFSPLGDSYIEIENISNTSTTIVSNAISTLKDIRVGNIDRLISGHLIINSLRNEFTLFFQQIKGSILIFSCYRNRSWMVASH